MNKILQGDVRESLKIVEDRTIQTCVTSPPYWGLRDYGTAEWEGGDEACEHRRMSKKSDKTITGHKNFDEMLGVGDAIQKDVCNYCGAKRKDSQLGLEKTPEEYVEHMVQVFREVKRTLRDDGTLWLNLGDSYAGSGKGPAGNLKDHGERHLEGTTTPYKDDIIKPKDLVGIPWRVAFALQADGWYLRQDIIWHKPNPMPESVTDRCTKSHEYIFLIAKSQKYYYDHEAIQEKTNDLLTKPRKFRQGDSTKTLRNDDGAEYEPRDTRNKRSVWTVTTKPYEGAHFAVFPEELIAPCILAGSKAGDTVLDPFTGSGTTLALAKKFNRKWLGVELNPEYIKLAEERIESVTPPMF